MESQSYSNKRTSESSSEQTNKKPKESFVQDYYDYDYDYDYHQRMKKKEMTHSPKPYVTKMRAIVVDWIIEVHQKLNLRPETLHLTINLIDRYCGASSSVKRGNLQCIGVSALFIASKYEEIDMVPTEDCTMITNNTCSKKKIIKMENTILVTIDYELTVPTIYRFLVIYLKVVQGSPLTQHLAEYYTERALLEHDTLKYLPSIVASAAVFLALKSSTLDCWPLTLERYSGYTTKDVIPVAVMLARFIHTPFAIATRLLDSIQQKYATKRHMKVSGLDHPKPEEIQN